MDARQKWKGQDGIAGDLCANYCPPCLEETGDLQRGEKDESIQLLTSTEPAEFNCLGRTRYRIPSPSAPMLEVQVTPTRRRGLGEMGTRKARGKGGGGVYPRKRKDMLDCTQSPLTPDTRHQGTFRSNRRDVTEAAS